MDTTERNLALIRGWERLYNTDRNKLLDVLYAVDCRVVYNGGMEINGRETLREHQARTDEHAPHRELAVERVHAVGDTVVVETAVRMGHATTAFGACVVLTFRDGKIIEDHTYADTKSASLDGA